MFLLNEDLLNEGLKINWKVFSNFSTADDDVEELKDNLTRANRYYRSLTDEKLLKERDSVSKFITTFLRFSLDLEGAINVIFAPCTLGVTLITYLLTRLLRLPIDESEKKFYLKQADQTIDALKDLAKKQPKNKSDIEERIKKLQRIIDEVEY